MKNNHVLVEQSSHSVLLEDKYLMYHTLLEILFIGKDTSRRTLFNLTGEAPVRYC